MMGQPSAVASNDGCPATVMVQLTSLPDFPVLFHKLLHHAFIDMCENIMLHFTSPPASQQLKQSTRGINQSIILSIDHSANQYFSQSIIQSINHSVTQSFIHSINQYISQSNNVSINPKYLCGAHSTLNFSITFS